MSGLKHVIHKRLHLERGQNEDRKNKLGFLEKKKDYKRRAEKFHLKERIIANLEEKARIANPQEFNFKMTKSKVQDDGTVIIDQTTGKNELKTVDKELKYVEHRINILRKKIDKDLPFVGASFIQHNNTHCGDSLENTSLDKNFLDKNSLLEKSEIERKTPTSQSHRKLSTSLDQMSELIALRDKLSERKKILESTGKKVPIIKVSTPAQAIRIHKLAPERKK